MDDKEPATTVEQWVTNKAHSWPPIQPEEVRSVIARLPTGQLLLDYAKAVRSPAPDNQAINWGRRRPTEEECWNEALPVLCEEIGRRVDKATP